MYVVASVAVSLDGCIDDAGPDRLVLSNAADLDRVDEVRAGVDAILVGAGTVRADDPRLRVRSADRCAARVERGSPEQPLRVVLSTGGALDPAARIFVGGALVYTTGGRDLPGEVVAVPDLPAALADLTRRGVRRLLVEGGSAIHTLFLTSGLVDELHVAVAPIFVGDPAAPRFVGAGTFPRLELVGTRAVGDVALLTYRTSGG